MRVSVTFRNISASEPIKAYAQDKMSRLRRFLIQVRQKVPQNEAPAALSSHTNVKRHPKMTP